MGVWTEDEKVRGRFGRISGYDDDRLMMKKKSCFGRCYIGVR